MMFINNNSGWSESIGFVFMNAWTKKCLACIAALVVSFQVQADTYYFHNDQLGTPQVLTDSAQQVVWQGNYEPFGKLNETVATVEQNIRFPGQYFDKETELHYNYFRTYDPNTGRYVESDPIGLSGGVSTYGYGLNSPNSNIDRFGLKACSVFVTDLMSIWSSHAFRGQLGLELIGNRNITFADAATTGYKNDLVGGGQRGDVSRHIYGHSGAYLLLPAISYGNQLIDYGQRYQAGRTIAESTAEIAGDIAGRAIARAMLNAQEKKNARERAAEANGQCALTADIESDLEDFLKDVLCL